MTAEPDVGVRRGARRRHGARGDRRPGTRRRVPRRGRPAADVGRRHRPHPATRQPPRRPRPRLPHRAGPARAPRERPGSPRGLPAQRPGVPRVHARRVQGPRRPAQRQLPVRGRRVAPRTRRLRRVGRRRPLVLRPDPRRGPRRPARPPRRAPGAGRVRSRAPAGRGVVRGRLGGRRRANVRRCAGARTTSTSSTPAAPPAGPKGCCGATGTRWSSASAGHRRRPTWPGSSPTRRSGSGRSSPLRSCTGPGNGWRSGSGSAGEPCSSGHDPTASTRPTCGRRSSGRGSTSC